MHSHSLRCNSLSDSRSHIRATLGPLAIRGQAATAIDRRTRPVLLQLQLQHEITHARDLQLLMAPFASHSRTATRPGSHPALGWPPQLPDSSRVPDAGPHHCCSAPSVHPGTAYQRMSGSSIGGGFCGSFSGTMPSGFAGAGGGSLGAMLAAQQGFGFGAGPGGLGPWGPPDAQGPSHIGQPGRLCARVWAAAGAGHSEPFCGSKSRRRQRGAAWDADQRQRQWRFHVQCRAGTGWRQRHWTVCQPSGCALMQAPPALPLMSLHRLGVAVHLCKPRRTATVVEGSADRFLHCGDRPCQATAILFWWLS